MDQKLAAKVLSFRWLLFAILALAYCFVYFHRMSLSVVATDLVKDFKATASAIGLLGSIYFYCYAAMQFPAGLLSDSVGPRRTVTYSLLLAAAGCLLFALAPGLKVAMIARAMVGLGVSMVFIPTMKILSQWFRAREFAFMSGLMQAAGGAGILVATALLGWLATHIGWRPSFGIIVVCTLLIVVAAWRIVRDRPTDKGWPSLGEIDQKRAEDRAVDLVDGVDAVDVVDGAGSAARPPSPQRPPAATESSEAAGIAPASPAPDAQPPKQIGLWQGVRTVASEWYFWPVAVWFFLDCGVFFGFGNLWSGPYLTHVYGMDKTQVGAILSWIAWGMILGGPALGWLSQKVLKSRKNTFILCTSGLTVLLLLLAVFSSDLSPRLLAGWFFLFSVCSSAIVIMGFTATKELFPVEIAGTSVGMVNFFPFFGGAIFMPLLGWILDACPTDVPNQYPVQAYRVLLLVLLAASLLALGCTFLMKETYRK